MKDLGNFSLWQYNTFGIEAHCRRFLEFATVEEAQKVAKILRETTLPYIIIGGGSNLLLTKDFDGIVVHSAIRGISIVGSQVFCGSGMVWDDVVSCAIFNHLYGAENLSLIPGDVGATAVQNIGAYGVEVKDLILEVEAVEIATGRLCIIPNEECAYAYRQSRFKQEWKNQYLITHVTYKMDTVFEPHLDYGNIRAELERRNIDQLTAPELRQIIIDIRNAKLPDPEKVGNAGSFFMNPIVSRKKYEELAACYNDLPHYTIDADHEKIPAGWLIEQCGWKGKSMGRAGVHDKQALVLVNLGGATGQEILSLCKAIQNDVWEVFGISIYPEVNII